MDSELPRVFSPSVPRGLNTLPNELLVEISKRLESQDSCKRSNLRSLSLSSKRLLHSCNEACASLSLSGLKASKVPRLLRRFPQLTSLNLSFLFDCSDDTLAAIGRACPLLKELNVPDTCKASPQGPPSPRAAYGTPATPTFPHVDSATAGAENEGKGLLAVCRGCPDLEVLRLPQFKGSEASLMGLGQGGKLRLLSLKAAANVNDRVVQRVVQHWSLVEDLDLSFTSITDEAMYSIGSSLPNLRRLDLKHCKLVSGAGIAALAQGCRKLQNLHLGCLELDDAGISALGKFSRHLEELSLDYGAGAHGPLSMYAFDSLATGCPRLRVLSLRGSKKVDDIGLRGLARGCPSLEELDLHACGLVGDGALTAIVWGCKKLKVLILTGTSIGPAAHTAFAGGLPRLSVLRVNGDMITDTVLKAVAEACPALMELHLNNCPVTDEGVAPVLTKCGGLSSLVTKACAGITGACFEGAKMLQLHTVQMPSCGVNDQGLLAMATSSPLLMSLIMSGCAKLTGEGCAKMLRCMAHLSSVVLTGCPQFTRDDVLMLTKAACPGLKLLRVSRPGSMDDEYTVKRALSGWALPCWARGVLGNSSSWKY